MTPEEHGSASVDFQDRDKRLLKRLFLDGVLHSGAQALDIGAGTGHIANAMRAEGIDVACMEPDPDSVNNLIARGFQTFKSLEDIRGPFDFISIIEVIEHVDDPVTELRKIRNLLKPEGTLFITTPCGETRLGSRKTNAYDSAMHVQFFTERSLNEALKRAGFAPLLFVTINELYPDSSVLKNFARSLRARLLGHYHLTGYSQI